VKKLLQNMVFRYYASSDVVGYDWAGKRVAAWRPRRLLDVGCGDGSRLFQYLQHKPERFCGVEGNPVLAQKARERGLELETFDLNGPWTYCDAEFDVVHAAQVIEHVHNTRQFLAEIFRVLAPGGRMVLTSENLCSLLNLSAMLLGYTPFPLQQTCGWYVGNPLGLHDQEYIALDLSASSLAEPQFSGVSGHVRVLSVRQAEDLLAKIGFSEIEVSSCGLMPLPGWLGRLLEPLYRRRGHFLLMTARKPL
jgi:SAM-dependent methyltransferase